MIIMKKIKAEDIALLSKEAPGFMRAVEKVKQEKADFLIMSARAFTSEETTLREICVQYAREHDVNLVFAP